MKLNKEFKDVSVAQIKKADKEIDELKAMVIDIAKKRDILKDLIDYNIEEESKEVKDEGSPTDVFDNI